MRYITEVTGVREVSLLGSADLGYWKDRLAPDGLTPVEHDGSAQVLVVAAAMRYLGIRFTEVSFSVLVPAPDPAAGRDAAFLIAAFHSSRLLAFCERVLFSTPYTHADCRISTCSQVSIQVSEGGRVAFRAEMRSESAGREPLRTGADSWEGPIFLPARRHRRIGEGRLFYARLRGHTRVYPFVGYEDMVEIRPGGRIEALHALVDSHFVPREWAVREGATHARSKTYSWPRVFKKGS